MSKKKNQLQKKPPFDPAAMAGFVEATRAVIAHPTGSDGAWWQGMSCWGERIIGGWSGDDAYGTAAVEVHGETLCIGIEQRGAWLVIEIDQPRGFDPRAVSLAWASEVRVYSAGTWKPDAGWRADPVTVVKPDPTMERAF
jgi:hypothetical protein